MQEYRTNMNMDKEIENDEIIFRDEFGMCIKFEINNRTYTKGIKFSKLSVNSKYELKSLVKSYLENWNNRINEIIDEQYKQES